MKKLMSISQHFYGSQKGFTIFYKKKLLASRENWVVLIRMGVNLKTMQVPFESSWKSDF